MRLGLSALKSQCYKCNMVPSPSCERCGAPEEDPYHIFFVCPVYAVPRQILTQDLNCILSVDIVQNKKTSWNYFIVRFRNLRPPYQPHTIYNIARFHIFLWQIFITIFNILSSSQLHVCFFFFFLCLLLCQGEQLVAIAVCNPYVK